MRMAGYRHQGHGSPLKGSSQVRTGRLGPTGCEHAPRRCPSGSGSGSGYRCSIVGPVSTCGTRATGQYRRLSIGRRHRSREKRAVLIYLPRSEVVARGPRKPVPASKSPAVRDPVVMVDTNPRIRARCLDRRACVGTVGSRSVRRRFRARFASDQSVFGSEARSPQRLGPFARGLTVRLLGGAVPRAWGVSWTGPSR
jgi:hypothetical protein